MDIRLEVNRRDEMGAGRELHINFTTTSVAKFIYVLIPRCDVII